MSESVSKKKNPLTEHPIVCIVIPLLAIAVALFAVLYEKPKNFLPNPLLDQAEVLLVEEKYDEAIAKAEEAKTVEADNPRIYLVIYAAHELSDRHEEAMQALQEGTAQVKKRATGGKEIRAVLKAAEISREEGLAAVADFYSSFDQLKNLAQKFLRLLVRVFEGNERFVRMLGELERDIEAMRLNQRELVTTAIVVPDDVFNEKDMEACLGSAWNDIYAVAAKLGYTRAAVDEVRTIDVPSNHFLNVSNYQNYASISTFNSNNPISDEMYFGVNNHKNPKPGYIVSFYENVAEINFPRGTHIGMSANEVMNRFDHGMIERLSDNVPQKLYEYGTFGTAETYYLASVQVEEGLDSSISYSFGVFLSDYEGLNCQIGFTCRQGVVIAIDFGYHTYNISPVSEEAP